MIADVLLLPPRTTAAWAVAIGRCLEWRDRSALNSLLLIAALLLPWQLLYWRVGDIAMRPPLATVRYAAGMFASEQFWGHLRESMRAFAAPLAICDRYRPYLGLWLDFHRLSGDVVEPMLVALYSIPKITLYPILLLMFGMSGQSDTWV